MMKFTRLVVAALLLPRSVAWSEIRCRSTSEAKKIAKGTDRQFPMDVAGVAVWVAEWIENYRYENYKI
jgi:hypothetical protein